MADTSDRQRRQPAAAQLQQQASQQASDASNGQPVASQASRQGQQQQVWAGPSFLLDFLFPILPTYKNLRNLVFLSPFGPDWTNWTKSEIPRGKRDF